MSSYRLSLPIAVLVTVAIGLTLATAYLHFWVGGTLLLLNAAGYLTLAVATAGTALAYRMALPVVLIALAGYAAVTILGWLVMGPYFDVAYLAKALEVALIATIAITLWLLRTETRASVAWALSLPRALLSALRSS
jgi:hypothetical protein